MSTPTDREILEELATAEQWTAKPLWLDDLTVMRPFAKRQLEAADKLESLRAGAASARGSLERAQALLDRARVPD